MVIFVANQKLRLSRSTFNSADLEALFLSGSLKLIYPVEERKKIAFI